LKTKGFVTLPACYASATWRNTTAVDGTQKALGIGFDAKGNPIRLKLSLESARHLAETLAQHLGDYDRSQSAKSSEDCK
jgi:hypothetical protein